jgi:phage shock protein A
MGVFTRLRDIISSNVNCMLDRAEDPEKLIRLMIQEMEDTLVEIKAGCAGAMAARKKVERELSGTQARAEDWQAKAELAVDKGREDLAREALITRRAFLQRVQELEQEAEAGGALVEQYHDDISQLEQKLATVREKQRVLIQRHKLAHQQKRAQSDIRKAESAEVMLKFEQFENRVERMEAEAQIVNLGRQPGLAEQIDRLAGDEQVEQELAALKKSKSQSPGPVGSDQ